MPSGAKSCVRPCPRRDHDDRRLDDSSGRLHPGDAPPVGQHLRRPRVQFELHAAIHRGAREGVGGGIRVGVAGAWLVGHRRHIADIEGGIERERILGRDDPGIRADLALHRDVRLEMIAILRRREGEQTDRPEAAVPADQFRPVGEVSVALDGEARLRLVRVVHAHEGAGLAGRARREMPALDDDHLARAHLGEMEGGAAPVRTRPNDDHIGGLCHTLAPLLSRTIGRATLHRSIERREIQSNTFSPNVSFGFSYKRATAWTGSNS